MDIPSTNFSSLEYGDKLVFSIERDIDGATAANQTYYQCQVNVWVDGVGTPILNGENGVINIDNDDDIEVNLTNQQVDLIKQNGMSLNGHYVILLPMMELLPKYGAVQSHLVGIYLIILST